MTLRLRLRQTTADSAAAAAKRQQPQSVISRLIGGKERSSVLNMGVN